MTDVIKTSTQSGPPSIALAMMAMRKAGYANGVLYPTPRTEIDCGLCFPYGSEYYRIIDRISRGAKP